MVVILVSFVVLLFTHVDTWFVRLVLGGLVVAAYFFLGPAWVAVPAVFAVVLLIKSQIPDINRFM